MAKTLVIPSKFTAEDATSSVVNKLGRNVHYAAQKMEALNARSERWFRKLTPQLSAASKQMLSMVGTGALVAGAFQLGHSSIQSVMDYETAMKSLQAVTGSSDQQMVGFNSEINTLAKSSRKSAKDVAASFETIGSAMSQYLDDPKGLRQIADAGITLSKAARTELQPTLEDLTSIMNQFGLRAEDAAKSVNILTAGEIVGSIRTSEASGYLKDFGATAKNMGVDLAESTALIEALGVQMSKDKIGTGARNLLTIISAAGGLDKKARKDLVSSGVDMKFLMDKTQSLSARLHELSKIAKDPIKMVSVFGKENLTAGQVIFNQLGKYDDFVGKIRVTSKAQEQAATNSDTLQNRLSELSNAWSNMLTSSNGATSGLSQAKRAIMYVTDNLESLVSTGLSALKFFALWKAANLTMKAVTIGYNVVMGIRNALQLKSLALLEGNVIATRASIVTEKLMVAQIWISKAAMSAWSVVTAVATGDMIALNAAMTANPIGLVVVAVAALAAGIGYLIFQQQALREEYERESNARIIKAFSLEEQTVDSLTRRYIKLGMSKEEAFKASLKFERQTNALERVRLTGEIEKIKSKNGGEATSETVAKTQELTQLASRDLQLTRMAISKSKVNEDYKNKYDMTDTKISAKDLMGTFESTKVTKKEIESTTTNNQNTNQSMVLTIKNDGLAPVEMSNGFTKTWSVMPQTTSTMSTKK